MDGLIGKGKLNMSIGDVKDIKITWKNPITGDKKTKTITSNNSSDIVFYKNEACTQKLNITSLGTSTFYIKNLKSEYLLEKIEVTETLEVPGYTIMHVSVSESTTSAGQQRITTVTEEVIPPSSVEFTCEIPVKYKYGAIKTTKKGLYNANNEIHNKNNSLTVQYKIYCQELQGWIKGTVTENKDIVANKNNATEYTTGTTVKRLLSNFHYKLVEVAITGSTSKYYLDPINIVKFETSKPSDITEQLTKINEKQGFCEINNILTVANSTNTIKIYDERTSGDITIVKNDDKYSKVKLAGTKVRIYFVGDYYDAKGWLVKNEDGTFG